MAAVAEAVTRLRLALGADSQLRIGGLRLYGNWEGGQRGERWYVLAGVQSEGDALKLVLKDGKELLILGFAGLDIWPYAITIRRADYFVLRFGPGQEWEVRPPRGWPVSYSEVAFEFAI
jgi:hypothetical protein